MTTELEHFLSARAKRHVALAFLSVLGEAVLFLVVGVLAMRALVASAGELACFLVVIAIGAAVAVVAWREW